MGLKYIDLIKVFEDDNDDADDDDADDEGYIYPNLYPQAIAALPAQWMHQWC